MNDSIFTDLHNKAEEFVSITRLVNESSKLRKTHSEQAIKLIRQSMEISDILTQEFDIISRANKTTRDQDTMVQNYCQILESNIRRQREIIRDLMGGTSIDRALLEQLEDLAQGLSQPVQKAIILLHIIIQNDNDIILMDNLIINRKKFQRESIDQLKKLAFRTLEDSDNAIRGSSSNLKRGIQLVKRLKDARRYIEENNRDELLQLIDEAHTGWNISVAVNRSSITQLVFAEQVNQFTEKLHEDSIAIRDLVVAKHDLFNRNLELMTELTVILSLEIKDFLPALNLVDEVGYDLSLPKDIRFKIGDLTSYVAIACADISFVSNLNFDMTDSINLNADLEKKSIDLTKIKLEYFGRIREEVRNMTEVTKYPIEGSGRNIDNGKMLESYLSEMLRQIA